jgi:hypothetical protein
VGVAVVEAEGSRCFRLVIVTVVETVMVEMEEGAEGVEAVEAVEEEAEEEVVVVLLHRYRQVDSTAEERHRCRHGFRLCCHLQAKVMVRFRVRLV